MLQLTAWSLPSLTAIALALGTLSTVRRRGGQLPGAGAIQGLCACVVLWALGQLLGSLATSLDVKIVASKLQYPGIALLPVAWMVFALTYVRRVRTVGARPLLALSAIPALTVVLAWSNELHHLLWTAIREVVTVGFVGMTLDYGVWFRVHVVYSYSLIAAGTLILIYELSASPQHRDALLGVIAAPAIVTALNLLHLSGNGPLFIDLTPLGLALGLMVFTRGVLLTGLLELSPTFHREVLEELADGVVILDAGGAVVDVNSAARCMLGAVGGQSDALGARLRQVGLSAEAFHPGSREVVIGGRSYDVRATTINGGGQMQARTALVFRDVTERLEAEAELRRLKQEMEHLAHTDPLTDLPNRRYFMRRLQEETGRCQRHGRELSVILMDLDRFKEVNDTYGHETGDHVLSVVAETIRACIRDSDVAARLGGEEFALLLPETASDEARTIGGRIRAAIEARVFAAPAGGTFGITASAGIATVCRDGPEPLKLADQALYRAKESGRNTVCD